MMSIESNPTALLSPGQVYTARHKGLIRDQVFSSLHHIAVIQRMNIQYLSILKLPTQLESNSAGNTVMYTGTL